MTNEERAEAIRFFETMLKLEPNIKDANFRYSMWALEALKQEPRMKYVQETVNTIMNTCNTDSIADKAMRNAARFVQNAIDGSCPDFEELPKIGYCKNCKNFEYDSVAKVNGIPLIVAHEICKRWGDGCQSKEDGYCFLFEPQESEVHDADSN